MAYSQQNYPGNYPGNCPGNYYPGVPPKKNRTGLIVALVVVAFLVVGGIAGGAAYLLNRDNDDKTSTASGDPTRESESTPGPTSSGSADDAGTEEELMAVANEYVDAVNKHDEAAATNLRCGKSSPGELYEANSSEDGIWQAENPLITPNSGKASVDVLLTDCPSCRGIPLPFTYQNGQWCVAG